MPPIFGFFNVYGKEKDEEGEEKETFKFFRGYTVFNYEQTKEFAAQETPFKKLATEDQAIKLLEEVKTITQNFWTNYEVVA